MDPLANLQDIHLPAQVHNYPIAPGWWLLMLLSLALIIFTVIKIRRFRQYRKAKKTALSQLKNSTSVTETMTIVKWVLLEYFPREKVANLSGITLEKFLLDCLPEKYQADFTQKTTADSYRLFDHLYQSDDSPEQFCPEQYFSQINEAIAFWLNQALPPKKVVITSMNSASMNSNGGGQ